MFTSNVLKDMKLTSLATSNDGAYFIEEYHAVGHNFFQRYPQDSTSPGGVLHEFHLVGGAIWWREAVYKSCDA